MWRSPKVRLNRLAKSKSPHARGNTSAQSLRGARGKSSTHFIPLALARKFEALAAQRGVSKVARGEKKSRVSDGGFFQAAKRANGRKERLSQMPIRRGAAQTWWQRRNAFCARHRAQQAIQKDAPLESRGKYKGTPTRRELGMIMWMCSSLTPAQLRKTLPAVKRAVE